jgi:hypothetical protein
VVAWQLPLNQTEATASKCAKETLRHLPRAADLSLDDDTALVLPAIKQLSCYPWDPGVTPSSRIRRADAPSSGWSRQRRRSVPPKSNFLFAGCPPVRTSQPADCSVGVWLVVELAGPTEDSEENHGYGIRCCSLATLGSTEIGFLINSVHSRSPNLTCNNRWPGPTICSSNFSVATVI